MKKIVLLLMVSMLAFTSCSLEDLMNGSESRVIKIVNATGIDWKDAIVSSYDSAVGLENEDPYIDMVGNVNDGKTIKAHVSGDVVYVVLFNEQGEIGSTEHVYIDDKVVFGEGSVIFL